MAIENQLTHFDDQGNARMVAVGEKESTQRTAVAAGRVLVNEKTYELIRTGGCKKGDVLTVAQLAGIMGAKRTPELIPLCHPILLSGVEVTLHLETAPYRVEICASVHCTGQTGVEMEALTAVSAAALTVYDMCKAVQRDMEITDIRLLEKSGGQSGHFLREEEKV
jgi:cyclic pyranopterin phosphate synthase